MTREQHEIRRSDCTLDYEEQNGGRPYWQSRDSLRHWCLSLDITPYRESASSPGSIKSNPEPSRAPKIVSALLTWK